MKASLEYYTENIQGQHRKVFAPDICPKSKRLIQMESKRLIQTENLLRSTYAQNPNDGSRLIQMMNL